MTLFKLDSQSIDIEIVQSRTPGPSLCIVGGVHGNEICGVRAIQAIRKVIISSSDLILGKLTTVIANPYAVQKKLRYIDYDLNRSFGSKHNFGHEHQISLEIKKYLQNVDFLIDIHSTSAPTEPFCAGGGTIDHFNLFHKIDVPTYTYGWNKHRGNSMLIDEVDRRGGTGIIVECGKNDSKKADNYALKVSTDAVGLFLNKKSVPSSCQKRILKVKSIIKAQTSQFFLSHPYKNFYRVNSDEVVAYDGSRPLKWNFPFFMVMPTHTKIRLGDEAFGIGVEMNSIYKH